MFPVLHHIISILHRLHSWFLCYTPIICTSTWQFLLCQLNSWHLNAEDFGWWNEHQVIGWQWKPGIINNDCITSRCRKISSSNHQLNSPYLKDIWAPQAALRMAKWIIIMFHLQHPAAISRKWFGIWKAWGENCHYLGLWGLQRISCCTSY